MLSAEMEFVVMLFDSRWGRWRRKQTLLTIQYECQKRGKVESSTEETPSASPPAASEQAEDTKSTEAVEELKKEFAQYNQHNVPRDKREAEKHLPRRPKTLNKKAYQRSRGRNKR